LRLDALSLLLHRSPPANADGALLTVASRLMAAAAATSAAGRTTHDSYGLKLERAVLVIVTLAAAGWW